ncbi:Protein of unknown function, partial [Gryllus bimaculatus]
FNADISDQHVNSKKHTNERMVEKEAEETGPEIAFFTTNFTWIRQGSSPGPGPGRRIVNQTVTPEQFKNGCHAVQERGREEKLKRKDFKWKAWSAKPDFQQRRSMSMSPARRSEGERVLPKYLDGGGVEGTDRERGCGRARQAGQAGPEGLCERKGRMRGKSSRSNTWREDV